MVTITLPEDVNYYMKMTVQGIGYLPMSYGSRRPQGFVQKHRLLLLPLVTNNTFWLLDREINLKLTSKIPLCWQAFIIMDSVL